MKSIELHAFYYFHLTGFYSFSDSFTLSRCLNFIITISGINVFSLKVIYSCPKRKSFLNGLYLSTHEN